MKAKDRIEVPRLSRYFSFCNFELNQKRQAHTLAFPIISLIFTLPHHLAKEDTVHEQLIGTVPVGAEVGVVGEGDYFQMVEICFELIKSGSLVSSGHPRNLPLAAIRRSCSSGTSSMRKAVRIMSKSKGISLVEVYF